MKGKASAKARGCALLGLCAGLALAALLPVPAAADVPLKITYQGNIRQNGNLVTGQRNITFKIYPSSDAVTELWTSPAYLVSVSTGVFKVDLAPAITDLTAANWESGDLWLELIIEGVPLSPRDQITSSPYSVNTLLHSGKRYTTAALAPASPALGDLWFDTAGNVLKYYNGLWIVSGAGVPMGDDLGNHTAIQALNLAGQQIYGAAAVTASSFTALGAGFGGAQLRLADNVFVSSEASAALGAGVRISSNTYIVGFASAAAVYAGRFYGDGSSLTGISGDNLGDHTAGQTLRMGTYQVTGSGSLTMSSATFTGIGLSAAQLNLAAGVRISSATAAQYGGVYSSTHVYAAGNVYAATFYGSAAGLTGLSGADSLGTHIATRTLDMAGFGLVNVASLTAAGYLTTYSSMSVGGLLGAGSIYTAGVSSFSGNAFFTGSSTFTDVADVYFGGGGTGQVLSKAAWGGMQWSDVSSMVSGDNLGTHVATKTLDMAGFGLVRVSSVNFLSNVFLTSATADNFGGVYASTHVYTPGNVYATRFVGDGSGLSGLSAIGDNLGAHVATKTLDMASFNLVRVSSVNFLSNVFLTSAAAANYGGVYASTHVFTPGNVYATRFVGDGSGLSGLSAIGDNLGTHVATKTLDMAGQGL